MLANTRACYDYSWRVKPRCLRQLFCPGTPQRFYILANGRDLLATSPPSSSAAVTLYCTCFVRNFQTMLTYLRALLTIPAQFRISWRASLRVLTKGTIGFSSKTANKPTPNLDAADDGLAPYAAKLKKLNSKYDSMKAIATPKLKDDSTE